MSNHFLLLWITITILFLLLQQYNVSYFSSVETKSRKGCDCDMPSITSQPTPPTILNSTASPTSPNSYRTQQRRKTSRNSYLTQYLSIFKSYSSNDGKNKHLWYKGASLFIPQMNSLLMTVQKDYMINITNIEKFEDTDISKKLGKLFDTKHSDKANYGYHLLYAYIFGHLDTTDMINILEIGLGTNNTSLISNMGPGGHPGASLYAWSEFLPTANIYGADVDKNILFQHDRIKTCYVNQLDMKTLRNVTEIFGNIKFDLIIDDGLHAIGANFNTLLFALDNIRNNGWIVIEDIHDIDPWKMINYILSSNKTYNTFMVKTKVSWLYVVHIKLD